MLGDFLTPLNKTSLFRGDFNVGQLGPLSNPILEALSRADGWFPGGKHLWYFNPRKLITAGALA